MVVDGRRRRRRSARRQEGKPGLLISVDDLKAARESLPDLGYRRFVCNMWVERAGHWLPPGIWQKRAGEPKFTDGEDIFIAADLGGGIRSSSAVVWCNRELQIGAEISFDEYPVELVLDVVSELAKRYRIRKLVADEWRTPGLFEEAKQRGIPVDVFPQSDSRMRPASQRAYEAIVEGKLTHPNDDALNKQVADTVARTTRRGWRVDRPDRDTPVDGCVAMVMAVDEALAPPPPPTEFLGWL